MTRPWIVAIHSQGRFDSRRAFARRVREAFPFIDAAGRMQVADDLKTVTAPETVLTDAAPRNRMRQLEAAVPEPAGVASHRA